MAIIVTTENGGVTSGSCIMQDFGNLCVMRCIFCQTTGLTNRLNSQTCLPALSKCLSMMFITMLEIILLVWACHAQLNVV